MFSSRPTRLHARKGFTLVELLIVIVIIGMLAAMALPNFKNTTATAQEGTLRNDVANAMPAMEAYFFKSGSNTYVGATLENTNIAPSPGNTIVLSNLSASGFTVQAYSAGISRQCTQTGGMSPVALTCSAYP